MLCKAGGAGMSFAFQFELSVSLSTNAGGMYRLGLLLA